MKNIYFLTREYNGIAGKGGVKDVCRGLAEALVRKGHKVRVFLPKYGFISDYDNIIFTEIFFKVDMNYTNIERREVVRIWKCNKNGVEIFLIDSPRFIEKHDIYTYTSEEEAIEWWKKKGEGHIDYFAMNTLLQKSALLTAIFLKDNPNLIHCHDGHTSLTPALARELMGIREYFRSTKFLITIHNAGLGYQQDIDDINFAKYNTDLPWNIITNSIHNNNFNPILCGSNYALINTVSPYYAWELQNTPLDEFTGWLGHHLKHRKIKIHGITNGITPNDFDVKHRYKELGLPYPYSPLEEDLKGKLENKKFLINKINNKEIDNLYGNIDTNFINFPMLSLVSRITQQKGIDVLIESINILLEKNIKFTLVILGTGESYLEEKLKALAYKNMGRIAVIIKFDESISNLVFASGDFFIIPSNFEPCGLTDFKAQLFGNIPIVHAIGGLNKVKDNKTGFWYEHQSPINLANTIEYAINVCNDFNKKIEIIKHGINVIFEKYTWDKVCEEYLKLYKLNS